MCTHTDAYRFSYPYVPHTCTMPCICLSTYIHFHIHIYKCIMHGSESYWQWGLFNDAFIWNSQPALVLLSGVSLAVSGSVLSQTQVIHFTTLWIDFVNKLLSLLWPCGFCGLLFFNLLSTLKFSFVDLTSNSHWNLVVVSCFWFITKEWSERESIKARSSQYTK